MLQLATVLVERGTAWSIAQRNIEPFITVGGWDVTKNDSQQKENHDVISFDFSQNLKYLITPHSKLGPFISRCPGNAIFLE